MCDKLLEMVQFAVYFLWQELFWILCELLTRFFKIWCRAIHSFICDSWLSWASWFGMAYTLGCRTSTSITVIVTKVLRLCFLLVDRGHVTKQIGLLPVSEKELSIKGCQFTSKWVHQLQQLERKLCYKFVGMSTVGLEQSTKNGPDRLSNFMSPRSAKSVPGPVVMNGSETCQFLATGGGN